MSEKLAILISYNTVNGGREPLGVPSHYDFLNVALSDRAVEGGSDDYPTRMVRDVGDLVQSTAFAGLAAESFENFEISPQEVAFDLLGLRQLADGSSKTIEIA